MSSEYDTKSILIELMKEGENKNCIDCDVPMPQWASLSFGVFCCLTCSGAHRGLGVHISFVRSLTMDKWTEAQVIKMQKGGNQKCREFFESSPGYSKSMSIQDKYTSHFAAQYKDKLLAEIEGRSWVPSDTPAPSAPSGSSSLRKPRALGSRVASPAPSRSDSSLSSASGGVRPSQKAANEDFFASLGARNDSRREDLPPSQGGKYGGFGSDASYTPSTATSSRALPSLDDLRDDPVSALGRGWGFLGAALTQASKAVNETVVQPTLERANDPALQSQLSSYLSKATTVLGEASRKGGEVLASGLHTGSEVIRRDLGYNVGDLGATYVERVTGRGAGGGYGQVGTFEVPSHETHDDFFENHLGAPDVRQGYGSQVPSPASSRSNPSPQPGDYPSAQEDSWAKLAPKSVTRSSAATSKPASGRSSPAAVAAVKKPAAKDEWDEW